MANPKHTKSNFKKKMRKAEPKDLMRTYNELKSEYAYLKAKTAGGHPLEKESGLPRIIRKQIAILLTIARERGIHLDKHAVAKDKARFKWRI